MAPISTYEAQKARMADDAARAARRRLARGVPDRDRRSPFAALRAAWRRRSDDLHPAA